MSGPAERLAALGLTLPPVVAPLAAYVPAVLVGGFVYTSGQLPMVDGKLSAVGKVGGEVSAQEAQRYTSLLSAESPQAVLEATRWLCEIDTRHVDAPALIFAVRADPLVPLKGIHALAEAIGATIVTLENTGHGIPLNPVWANVTAQIDPWLRATTAQQRVYAG